MYPGQPFVAWISVCEPARGSTLRAARSTRNKAGEALGGQAGDEAALLGVAGQLGGPGRQATVAEFGPALVGGDQQGEAGVVPAGPGAVRIVGQEGRTAGQSR